MNNSTDRMYQRTVTLDEWVDGYARAIADNLSGGPAWRRAPFFDFDLRHWQIGFSVCWGSETRGAFVAFGPAYLQLSWTR